VPDRVPVFGLTKVPVLGLQAVGCFKIQNPAFEVPVIVPRSSAMYSSTCPATALVGGAIKAAA
jgi:hypothetical protein